MMHDDEEERKSGWLITFTDTMALMLTFFVLMFAMSEPKPEYWSDMASALHTELKPFDVNTNDSGPVNAINLERVGYNKALDLNYLEEVFQQFFQSDEVLSRVIISKVPGAVVLSFPDDVLYEKGQANVNKDVRPVFQKLGDFLSQIRNGIVIHGHSDPTPVKEGAKYRSNLVLSMNRAMRVRDLLMSNGYDRQIPVRAYGDSQYGLISQSLGEQARYALSRRVDILILDNNGTPIDPI